MAKARVWTCQRVQGGKKCGYLNPRRKQICQRCGKRRPQTKQPRHRAALSGLTYEDYIKINGGERCGICGRSRSPSGRRLCKDHEHRDDGLARGLLCVRCNRNLPSWCDVAWLEAAIEYLLRAQVRAIAAESARIVQ